MEINKNAAVKAAKEIEIHAPLEKVWRIQADINAWPQWQPDISEATLGSHAAPGAMFIWKTGGFKLTSIITTMSEYKFIGWSGRGFGASAIHTWEFEQLESGSTLVRTKESMGGWLVWLLKGAMNKKLDESLDTWLNALKKVAESP